MEATSLNGSTRPLCYYRTLRTTKTSIVFFIVLVLLFCTSGVDGRELIEQEPEPTVVAKTTPSLKATSQPTLKYPLGSCELDSYNNRDDIASADSKDCVACYNAGCTWFDCADIDTDTASDCYDPNDAYRLETCTRQTFEECKSDYAGDMCKTGGVLLIVIGALLCAITGFIRYNEYHYELYRKSIEDVRFLDDGSLRDDGSVLSDKVDHDCCECEDSSTFWCYAFMFFAGVGMIIVGISLLVAYSILGDHVFDNLHDLNGSKGRR